MERRGCGCKGLKHFSKLQDLILNSRDKDRLYQQEARRGLGRNIYRSRSNLRTVGGSAISGSRRSCRFRGRAVGKEDVESTNAAPMSEQLTCFHDGIVNCLMVRFHV